MSADETTMSWDELEAAAQAEWRAQLDADLSDPPEFGRPIAWAVCRYKGVTDTISDVHRVGVPNGEKPYTICGMPIPDARMWVPLTPSMVDAMAYRMTSDDYDHMRRCPFCAATSSHFLTADAA